MASLDNQSMQTGTETVQAPGSTDGTVRNVTGYIHFNQNDDLSKLFNTLHQFRTSHGLKYSHHRDFIFFSVKSDCLSELAKVQPFRISHYRSKSEYSCTKDLADKLLAVRDSFVRMSWMETEGVVQFLSRTIGRVHNQLVYRIFKSASEMFSRTNYHFVRTPHHTDTEDADGVVDAVETQTQTQAQTQTQTSAPVQNTKTFTKHPRAPQHTPQHTSQHTSGQSPSNGRGGQTGRGGRGGHGGQTGRGGRGGQSQVPVSSDGFTKVVRNKSKYNNKVHVVSNVTETPRTRGTNQKAPVTKSTPAPPTA